MAGDSIIEGFWLPGLDLSEVDFEESCFGPGEQPLRLPILTPRSLEGLLDHLQEARAGALADRPLAMILDSIERACRLLTEPGGPYYEELVAVLPKLTGYSEPMIRIGLERMARGWTASALHAALAEEFGVPEVLDDFQRRAAGGYHRAYGPSLVVHIFSGNIPGVSVSSVIRALCVKSASLGKTAAGEPYFAVSFARALCEVDPDLASCVSVTYWRGGEEQLEAVAFARAAAVIAYGSDATIRDVRRRLTPGARFLAYPNRVGAALIPRETLDRASELARQAARDVVTFDQQGCVSPHVVFVERGGEVDGAAFAELLAAKLGDLADVVPRGAITPAESSTIHQLWAQAEVRGARVWASEGGTAWTVVYEDRPTFEFSPLNRAVHVRSVDTISEAIAALTPVSSRLQTVAVAGEEEIVMRLARQLGKLGVTRVALLGEAGWPAPHWHHDGRFQFLDLVRFTDVEIS